MLATLFPFNLGGTICAPCNGPDVQADWRQLNNALNFEIPDRYLEGTIYLRPYVNWDRRVAETNYDNNRGYIRRVTFRELDKRISIAYVPIHYHPAGYTDTQDPSSRIDTADWFLKHTWPVRPDYVDYYLAPIPDVDWTDDVNTGSNDGELLAHIAELREDLDPRPDHLYGWLPGGVYGGNGLAYVGRSYVDIQHAAYGNDTDGSAATSRYRRTFAHELEHNYGLRHDCDTIGARGFDVTNRVVKTDTLVEVMCAGRLERDAWADLDTYWRKYQAWGYYGAPGGNSSGAVSTTMIVPGPHVIVSGVITASPQGTTGELRPLHRVQRTGVAMPPTGQSYCLEFRNANGAIMQAHCFDLTFEADAERVPTAMPFAFTLPWPAGTVNVRLKHGQTVLAERTASAHAPAVHVTAPNGGENWSGLQTVQWAAADADGDALTFALLYSRDGGASWVPLTTGLTGTSYTVDTGSLAGGSQCLVKVRATDGMNTAEDTSNGVFTVPRKPPLAVIGSPPVGVTYAVSDTITLQGNAHDLEDGPLPDGQLTWYVGGVPMGSGRQLSVGPLAEGSHVVRLEARDADGNIASDTRTFRVGPYALHLPAVMRGGPQ